MRRAWESFFFSRADARVGGLLRITYAVVCLVNMGLLGLDLDLFYSEAGLVPRDAGRAILDPDAWTVFSLLPASDAILWASYWTLMLQLVLLGLGLLPRLQAACVFVWLVSFQHSAIVLFDGEDTVFRLLAFFLIFLPLHRFTILEWLRGRPAEPATWPIWPFRLAQLQMCLIFVSTFMLKVSAREWWDGSAMYYVVHLDDLYGKLLNPGILFGYVLPLRLMTWGTLLFEATVPVTVWFSRTRMTTLVLLAVFHLGMDLSMNLNLFHWIMLVGWASFLAQPLPSVLRDTPKTRGPRANSV